MAARLAVASAVPGGSWSFFRDRRLGEEARAGHADVAGLHCEPKDSIPQACAEVGAVVVHKVEAHIDDGAAATLPLAGFTAAALSRRLVLEAGAVLPGGLGALVAVQAPLAVGDGEHGAGVGRGVDEPCARRQRRLASRRDAEASLRQGRWQRACKLRVKVRKDTSIGA